MPAQRGGAVGDPSLTCRAHRHPPPGEALAFAAELAVDQRTDAQEGLKGFLLAEATRKDWPVLKPGGAGGEAGLGCYVCVLGPQ